MGTPYLDLGWGTPHLDLGWGTPPTWTWDGVPLGQTWDGVPPLPRFGMGYPPPGVDWQTENSTFPYPSDAGGNNDLQNSMTTNNVAMTNFS